MLFDSCWLVKSKGVTSIARPTKSNSSVPATTTQNHNVLELPTKDFEEAENA